MAYRRRQQGGRPDAFSSSHNYDSDPPPQNTAADGRFSSNSSTSSLATKAIRASAAYRDSSLSSAYEQSALSSPRDFSSSCSKVYYQLGLFSFMLDQVGEIQVAFAFYYLWLKGDGYFCDVFFLIMIIAFSLFDM